MTLPDKPAGTSVKIYVIADGNTKLLIWVSSVGKGQFNKLITDMNTYSSVVASMIDEFNPSCVYVDNIYTTQALHNTALN